MKASSFFWGTFFVILGLGTIFFDSPHTFIIDLISYWPMVFIAIGLVVMLRGVLKFVFAAILGAIVGILIISIFQNGKIKITDFMENIHQTITHDEVSFKDSLSTKNIQIPLEEGIKEADLQIDLAISKFSASADNLSNNKILLRSSSQNIFADYDIDSSTEGQKTNVNISFALENEDPFSFKDTTSRRANVLLNRQVEWNIIVNSGVGVANLDLSQNKIKSLTVSSGASIMFLKLGKPIKETNVYLEMGASKIEVMVPKSITCRVQTETGLSNVNVSGFLRKSKNEYISNETNSEEKINIRLESGMSSIDLLRY